MASEIKVDTISEKTSAGGVTIDGLLIKDGGISGDVSLIGTTPTFTIGDAGAEDAALVFDGNAQDYYVGLDDSSDSLVMGLGSALGTTPAITINSSQVATFAQAPVFPDGSIAIDDLNIDGGTDIGAALVDADEIIVDDGGGGTNRRCDMSRVKTYAKTAFPGIDDTSSSFDDCLTITDNEIVVNEDGDNQDFRVESDDLSNFFFCDASANIAGFSTHDRSDQGFIHITTGSSGQGTSTANADELVIEGSAHTGIQILAGATHTANIAFGDSGDADIGQINYDHNANDMIFTANATETLRIQDTFQITTGGETASNASAGGLTLDQNAADELIISLKSSDIAHGSTNVGQETDDFGFFKKVSATEGGLTVLGMSEGAVGLRLRGFADDAPSGKATSDGGCVEVQAMQIDGTGTVAHSANGNLMCVKNDGTTRFIFDADGDFHADSSSTTFDAYDDAQLARAFDLSHGKGVVDSKFDKFVAYNHEHLADLQLVGREKDGTPNHFINVSGMQRLHNGAIWQQYEKHERLLEAVYDLAKEAVGEDKANAILDKHEVKRLQ